MRAQDATDVQTLESTTTNVFFIFPSDDRCPMRFDDGANPWVKDTNVRQVFDFSKLHQYNTADVIVALNSVLLTLVTLAFVVQW